MVLYGIIWCYILLYGVYMVLYSIIYSVIIHFSHFLHFEHFLQDPLPHFICYFIYFILSYVINAREFYYIVSRIIFIVINLLNFKWKRNDKQ
ncbi:hypothetical protein Hanom_Chr00s000007g01615641 [Helianthus anomalus]